MKLYVLDLGKIIMMGDNPVTDSAQSGTEPLFIPIHAFLVDSPIGYILFDTGCNPEGMAGAWPEALRANPYVAAPEQQLLCRLAQLGLKPADISVVVLSHLHLDHAGGVHFFPRAKVYVQQEELERVLSDYAADTLDLFHVQCDAENWEKAGIQWQAVPRETETLPLCDGITILNLGPGHSYGMLGLHVKLKSGGFLLVADAAYSAKHYGPPAQFSGAVNDREGYLRTMEYLREYSTAHKAAVLFGHDPEQFSSLKKSTEGYYE